MNIVEELESDCMYSAKGPGSEKTENTSSLHFRLILGIKTAYNNKNKIKKNINKN